MINWDLQYNHECYMALPLFKYEHLSSLLVVTERRKRGSDWFDPAACQGSALWFHYLFVSHTLGEGSY